LRKTILNNLKDLYMSMNENFFSEINRDFVFGQIKDIIMSNHSVNILLDEEYKNIFNKNIHEIYNKSDNEIMNLDQLNNKLIISTIKLYQDKIKKSNDNKFNDKLSIDSEYDKINKLRQDDNLYFKKPGVQENKQISLIDSPELNFDNLENYNDSNITYLSNKSIDMKPPDLNNIDNNNNTKLSDLNNIDNNNNTKLSDLNNIDNNNNTKLSNKKNMKIISSYRYDDQSSRYNYKIDIKSNNIKFNNNKIEKMVIPIEENYIFSLPIIFLKIKELKLNISMKLEDTINNNHRLYGIYYPIENYNIKSCDNNIITINITDVSETIHNNIDILSIYKLEIINNKIILYNKFIINEYLVNDYIKLINYDNKIIDMESIINMPLKIDKIVENKIYTKNINNINDINMDINMRFINLSNQNMIFIK